MEKFKKSLKIKIVIYAVLIVVASILYSILSLVGDGNLVGDQASLDFARGFRLGVFGAFIVGMFMQIIKAIVLLNKEDRRRKAFIKISDERTNKIAYLAAKIQLKITIIGCCIAAIIASFYSVAIFATLIAVELASGVSYVVIAAVLEIKM